MHRRTRRVLLSVALMMAVLGIVPAVAQLANALERAEELRKDERPTEAIAVLEPYVDSVSGAERAEVMWRLAAATVMHGEQRRDEGAGDDEILALFEAGEQYGRQAIAADPSNPLGYYWTSGNIGRWGETRGVLNSLFRAPDMRDLLTEAVTRDPDHADSYFVLGQLYARVPGGIISFGNTEYAVSLARKSVDLMEAEVESGEREEANEGFYIQLASHLIDRGWNARRRSRAASSLRSDYRDADSAIERGFFYEGSVGFGPGDDESEAEAILRDVVRRLERVSNPKPSEERNLAEARELLDSI